MIVEIMDEAAFLYPYYLAHPHVCTDSRQVEKGDLFFALSGPRFDGNAFALSALDAGASYAVVSSKEIAGSDDRCLYVPDTLLALQALARHHRMQLDLPVMAITGTNGKTTTKELTKAVLSRKYRLLATEGNLNNHIGVPLTLLRLTKEHEMALVEMGASAPGEIAFLCDIARPTAGLITNVGKAHLEGFGSIEGVLKTKSELPDFLSSNDGDFFLNADDPRLFDKWSFFARMCYGIQKEKEPDVTCEILSDHPYLRLEIIGKEGHQTVNTHLTGRYNYQNVLAASSVGLHFGVRLTDIRSAIESYYPSNSRSQVITFERGITVVMDAYNANPSSMMAALTNLDSLEADTKIAILGDMLELGEASESEHRVITEWLEKHPDIRPYLCGEAFQQAAGDRFQVFPDSGELASAVAGIDLPDGACILIKGSRGIALESVLTTIQERFK